MVIYLIADINLAILIFMLLSFMLIIIISNINKILYLFDYHNINN